MSHILEGFRVPIRCNTDLAAVVQFFKPDDSPFDFTGYSAFHSSVKAKITDTVELFRLTVSVSTVSNTGATVAPTDGWLLLFAPDTETAKAQTTARVRSGLVRAFIDVIGIDSFGNRIPIGTGYAELMPSTTETFV